MNINETKLPKLKKDELVDYEFVLSFKLILIRYFYFLKRLFLLFKVRIH